MCVYANSYIQEESITPIVPCWIAIYLYLATSPQQTGTSIMSTSTG